jgi:hypothetical protein
VAVTPVWQASTGQEIHFVLPITWRAIVRYHYERGAYYLRLSFSGDLKTIITVQVASGHPITETGRDMVIRGSYEEGKCLK